MSLPGTSVQTCRSCTALDRKSTRLNSSHEWISYAVFCLKKKKEDAGTCTTDGIRAAPRSASADARLERLGRSGGSRGRARECGEQPVRHDHPPPWGRSNA